jgi:hypothetical protein
MSDPASNAYTQAVKEALSAKRAASTYTPPEPLELVVRDRRAPTSTAELSSMERAQFEAMWQGREIERLLAYGDEEDDMPLDVEVATVSDAEGRALYTLWAWNFGVVYLMRVDSLECVAFAAQHALEHWRAEQRPLFWAMDRALEREGHGVQQPMEFCWWDDACWARLEGTTPGMVGSEPHLREHFARAGEG